MVYGNGGRQWWGRAGLLLGVFRRPLRPSLLVCLIALWCSGSVAEPLLLLLCIAVLRSRRSCRRSSGKCRGVGARDKPGQQGGGGGRAGTCFLSVLIPQAAQVRFRPYSGPPPLSLLLAVGTGGRNGAVRVRTRRLRRQTGEEKTRHVVGTTFLALLSTVAWCYLWRAGSRPSSPIATRSAAGRQSFSTGGPTTFLSKYSSSFPTLALNLSITRAA